MHAKKLPEDFRQYTINRWYNYITSLIVCDFFEKHPRVKPYPDKRGKCADFFIDGKPFDLKMTFVPKAWSPERVLKSLRDPRQLITYYYKAMGTDRAHFGNKIFLVMTDIDEVGTHPWWMKREFDALEKVVKLYLDRTEGTEFFRNFEIRFKASFVTVSAADAVFLVRESRNFYYYSFKWKANIPEVMAGEINSNAVVIKP